MANPAQVMGSAGAVIAQPALGRVADVNGHGASYVVATGLQALAIPFIVLARREHAVSDPITWTPTWQPDSPADTGPVRPRQAPADPSAAPRLTPAPSGRLR